VSELDLFGHEMMHRSARFVGDGRIELRRKWGPGPTACAIGCNPSDAGAYKDDPTTHWWINWFRLFGFGGFVAVNLYPFVSASPDQCRRRVDAAEVGADCGDRDLLHLVNLPAVVEAAKAADQVFVCWGNIAWDQDWIDHVVEAIQTGEAPYPDLWCWGYTASGAPKHPMARGAHRIARDQKPILWRPA
jgi:hypothetical protein